MNPNLIEGIVATSLMFGWIAIVNLLFFFLLRSSLRLTKMRPYEVKAIDLYHFLALVVLWIPKVGYFYSPGRLTFGVSLGAHFIGKIVWAAVPSDKAPRYQGFRLFGNVIYEDRAFFYVYGNLGYTHQPYAGLIDPTRPLFGTPNTQYHYLVSLGLGEVYYQAKNRAWFKPFGYLYINLQTVSFSAEGNGSYFNVNELTTQEQIIEAQLKSCPWLKTAFNKEIHLALNYGNLIVTSTDIRLLHKLYEQCVGDEGATELNPYEPSEEDGVRGNTYAQLRYGNYCLENT